MRISITRAASAMSVINGENINTDFDLTAGCRSY
jgi:hypothetical protein